MEIPRGASRVLSYIGRLFRALICGLLLGALGFAHAQTQSDPLPSWNEGATKKSVTDFVARVTTQGSPDFVPLERRIATFELDKAWDEGLKRVGEAF